MTKTERQITLETRMYRKGTFGKMDFCSMCWAHCNIKGYSCIANGKIRSMQCLCAQAEARLDGPKYTEMSNFMNLISGKTKKYKPLLGLTKKEMEDE